MDQNIQRHSFVRPSHVLLLGLALLAAACSGDSPTQPQMDQIPGLASAAGASSTLPSDLEDDGFRLDQVDPSDKEYDGEDGPFEHVLRAPNGVELVFRFAGKIRAREELSVTLRARSSGQAVNGIVEVDFGDGRKVKEFDISRRADLTHTYRQEGRFRIFAIVRTEDGLTARGGFRIHIREPLRVALVGEVVGSAMPDEETVLRVMAEPMNERARAGEVHGVLTIDFGDKSDTATVREFEGVAARKHVYAKEGTYTVKLTLEANGRTFTSAFKIEVTDLPPTGDHIDMNQARSLHASDIASWTVSSQVTGVRLDRHLICVYHTAQNTWPAAFSNGVFGNLWIGANIGGTWYVGATEWIRRGDPCASHLDGGPAALGAYTKVPPLSGWRPRKGEKVILFVATPGRDATRTINHRTNAYMIDWPF